MTVSVLTAIYAGYDTLKRPCAQHMPRGAVEWLCVTDNEALARGDSDPMGWRICYEPRPGVHPNRAAKRPKMLPWQYAVGSLSIWIDASYEVTAASFAFDASTFAHFGIAQFVHPWRDCIYEEAIASEGLPKYDGCDLLAQVDGYRALGHPHHWGLWETGCIVRDHHALGIRDLGHAWLAECTRASFQDQLSEPFVLRCLGLRPAELPGERGGSWLTYRASVRHE